MALLGFLVALILKHTAATQDGIRVTFSFYCISIAIAFFQSNDALPKFIAERSIFAKEATNRKYR